MPPRRVGRRKAAGFEAQGGAPPSFLFNVDIFKLCIYYLNMKTLVQKISCLLCLVGVISLFVSCENFMDSSVRDEIENSIYIANHTCPVATVEEPVFSDTGVARNKAIIISFSMSVDPATFTGSYDIVDSDGKSLLENYNEPVWNSDYTKVSIYANELNPIKIEENATLDIFFKLSKNCKTKDGLPIEKALNHKFRINSDNDNVTPVIADTVKVSRPQLKYNNVIISEPVTFVEGSVTAATEKNICETNHIKSTLEFYVEGSDFGGGKVSAYITYRQVNDINGKAIVYPEDYIDDKITEELTEKTESGNYYKSFVFDFDAVRDKQYPEGMYKFSIYVIDQYSLKSTTCKEYYVIRDTRMAKSSSALIWFESPMYRVDWIKNGESSYPTPFDSQVPTAEGIDAVRQNVQFQYINNDTYYVSSYNTNPQTNKKINYSDEFNKFTYLFSWGSSLDNLTAPVQALKITQTPVVEYYGYKDPGERVDYEQAKDAEGNEIPGTVTYESWYNNWFNDTYRNIDGSTYAALSETKIIYTLPLEYEEFVKNNPDSDVFLQATVIDCVGNSNTVTTLSPKKIKYYGYEIQDETVDGKPVKRIKLNYSDFTSDLTSIAKIPDKFCTENYRIYYAKITGNEDATDSLKLIRNTSVPWREDPYSGVTDSAVFDIPANEDGSFSEYVVYIQPNYSTNSVLTGAWTGQTFGPVEKIIIDPKGQTSGNLTKPVIDVKHKSAGASTGLLDITVTITNPDAALQYVPCYSTDYGNTWVYPDFKASADKKTLTFTMVNPLIAPINSGDPAGEHTWKEEETWIDKWSGESHTDYLFRGDFFESIERVKQRYFEDENHYERWLYDYYNDVYFKVQVMSGNNKEESFISHILLWAEQDDNIPPYQDRTITNHDSRLSDDGHSYEFLNLLKEDQGHMSKTFIYYYTPYLEAWGDNLSVLSEEEIRALPSGMSNLKSNSYVDWDWSLPESERTSDVNKRVNMNFTPVVPIKGLEDGKYMFFGEFFDVKGNSSIITLGKADVGTFKNKPQVSCQINEDGNPNTLTIDFTREANEIFEKNYVYIECFNIDEGTWYEFLPYYSRLQKLNFTGDTASLTIKTTDSFNEGWNKQTNQFNQKTLNEYRGGIPAWNFYRITVQGFNEHPYDVATNTGVNKYYEAPYKEMTADGKNPSGNPNNNEPWTPWEGNYGVYIADETEYDLCTEETASCSTYFYYPGYWIDQNTGEYHYEEEEDFVDVRYSFSPDDATIVSNIKYIVNVYTSVQDLGDDIDEWERRGKLIKTHLYEPKISETRTELQLTEILDLENTPQNQRPPQNVIDRLQNEGDETWWNNHMYKKEKDENEELVIKVYSEQEVPNDDYKPLLDPKKNPFSFNLALEDLYNSEETGFMYYTCVVHFSNGETAISAVKTAYCF